MFKNYLKTTFRNLCKNKDYTHSPLVSKAYKKTLESAKTSAFVRFIADKFKVAHVDTMFSPKVESLFSFGLISFFSSIGNAIISTCFPINS